MGEPYVQQGAHQRFLIDARLFLGKNFPSPPLFSALLLGLGSLGAYLYGVTARATLGTSPVTELPLVARRCEECRTWKVVKNLVSEAVRGFLGKLSHQSHTLLTCHLPDPTRTPLRSSALPARRRQWA